MLSTREGPVNACSGDTCEWQVLSGEELRERGYGGLYGVGKAATEPPALCVLSHVPQSASKKVPAVCPAAALALSHVTAIFTSTAMRDRHA